MADTNCRACDDLKTNAPNVIVNGLGDAECSSLANDTGLSPSNPNTDCQDLKDLNDCLVGNMAEEVETHDVCEWRPFMKKLIPNIWTVQAAIICAVCGLWTNVHSLWDNVNRLWAKVNALEAEIARVWAKITDIDSKVNAMQASIDSLWSNVTNLWNTVTAHAADISKLYCYINYLFDGSNVSALLDESDFVAGTGVDFNRDGPYISRPTLRINGSTYTLTGSINIDTSTQHWGRLGLDNKGNPVKWGSGSDDYNRINTPNGNYTICYIKIQKSKLPSLKGLSSCVGTFVNAGTGQLYINAYDGDTDDNQMTGQWGYSSSSVTVPAGWIYLRVSLASLITWGIEYGGDNNAAVTFRATGLARTNRDGVVC